jgi:hypothetical protein
MESKQQEENWEVKGHRSEGRKENMSWKREKSNSEDKFISWNDQLNYLARGKSAYKPSKERGDNV